jgi:hypothetical protein
VAPIDRHMTAPKSGLTIGLSRLVHRDIWIPLSAM